MTKEEIRKIAEKIVSGTATEEEIVLYNRICGLAETPVNGSIEIPAAEKAEFERALKNAILRNIGRNKVYHMKWLKWTAAAVIFVLLAAAGYFFGRPSRSLKPEYAHQSPEQRFKNDVLPGQSGAILTLADGQKITLDSAANGLLVREGGAQVIKKDGAVIYDVNNTTAGVVYNTMNTPLGRQYQLTLADGTVVWLNAGSSITYPTVFTGKERKVKVTGEVYFEVAHNPSMPFRVEKGDIRIEVLGTHFNMNAYDDENSLKVTLLEGAVRVVSAGAENIIKPGQQAQVTKEKMVVVNNVNTEEAIAWKNGRFLFSGTDIGQLMRQLSRWYDVEVEYNGEIRDLFYAEIPRSMKLSDVLGALALTGKVHFTISGKKVTVMP